MDQNNALYFKILKKIIAPILLSFLFLFARAQKKPGCNNVIIEVTQIIEKDYPGYFVLSKEKRIAYEKFKRQILAQAIEANQFEINILINEYLKFFNDNHLNSIYFSNNYSDKQPINIYKGKKRQPEDIDSGLWFIRNFDIILQLRIINKIIYGYIYKDLNNFSKPGSRYLVVYPAMKNNYYNFLFISDDGVSFSQTVQYKNRRFYQAQDKIFMERIDRRKIKELKPIYNTDPSPTLKQWDKNTLQIRIPSLSIEYQPGIDSLLLANDARIKKTKTLIIDLRSNGGGSVLPTLGLIKYIKTGPIHYINSFSIASDTLIENAKRSCASEEKLHSNYYANYCNKFLPKMLANKGKMVFDSSELYDNSEPKLDLPQNVAVLIDNMTTSAAELFVLAACQSKKVKIFGENSAGGVDFGGVTSYFLKNSNHVLNLTTEMAEYIKERQYDGIGIMPDVRLSSKKENWIQEIIRFYARK